MSNPLFIPDNTCEIVQKDTVVGYVFTEALLDPPTRTVQRWAMKSSYVKPPAAPLEIRPTTGEDYQTLEEFRKAMSWMTDKDPYFEANADRYDKIPDTIIPPPFPGPAGAPRQLEHGAVLLLQDGMQVGQAYSWPTTEDGCYYEYWVLTSKYVPVPESSVRLEAAPEQPLTADAFLAPYRENWPDGATFIALAYRTLSGNQ